MEKVKVMIVDDSKVSRTILANHLSKTNFEVVAMAKDAADAIKLYQEHNPDLVTMDMNLPDADGVECSRRIRAMDPDAKIVMISAMKDANLVAQGTIAGISAFLQKPVSTNDIIDTLMMLCQKKVSQVAILRESYAKSFVNALRQGLFSMIGKQFEVNLELYDKKYLSVDGIAVIIGLTGTPTGRAIMYMTRETMKNFSLKMLGVDDLTEDEANDAVEEAANIIIGRGVSNINDVFKDKELRITPPGTICGTGIRVASPKLTTFKITASTNFGDICMNVGFAEGD